MKSQMVAWVAGALVLSLSAAAGAQPTSQTGSSTRPLSIGATGGLSTGMMQTGGAVGAGLTFDVFDRIAMDGRGIWLRPGQGASGLEISGTLLFTVLRGKTVSPYVGIGGGLYRARLSLGSQRMFGSSGLPFAPGTVVGAGQTYCGGGGMMGGMSCGTTWTDSSTGTGYNMEAMPSFYARRLGQLMVPLDGQWSSRSFTDPAMTLGFGAQVDLTERLYVRPEARALVVFGGGDTLTLGTVTVGFGVRF